MFFWMLKWIDLTRAEISDQLFKRATILKPTPDVFLRVLQVERVDLNLDMLELPCALHSSVTAALNQSLLQAEKAPLGQRIPPLQNSDAIYKPAPNKTAATACRPKKCCAIAIRFVAELVFVLMGVTPRHGVCLRNKQLPTRDFHIRTYVYGRLCAIRLLRIVHLYT